MRVSYAYQSASVAELNKWRRQKVILTELTALGTVRASANGGYQTKLHASGRQAITIPPRASYGHMDMLHNPHPLAVYIWHQCIMHVHKHHVPS